MGRKSLHSSESDALRLHLQTLRKEAGMTQRDLAESMGVEHSLIAKVELGERRLDVIEYFWLIDSLGLEPEKCFSKLVEAFKS